MVATSAGGTGVHKSTGPVNGVDTMREIVKGQAPGESLRFNPSESLAGQSAGAPALDETRAGRFEG